MKTEMDAMKMDERQRLCWLLANRVTLVVVGLLFVGLICWEFSLGNTPWLLIVAVPVVAAVRFGAYQFYLRRS